MQLEPPNSPLHFSRSNREVGEWSLGTFDHFPQHLIGGFHAVEQRGAAGIKEMVAQGLEGEGVEVEGVEGLTGCTEGEAGLLSGLRAIVDQPKQELQRLVKEVAVAGFVGGQVQLFQLPQALQSVAQTVGVGAHGSITQHGMDFDVEAEHQAVHVAQALAVELFGHIPSVEPLFAVGASVLDGGVDQALDAREESELQILGDLKRVFVGAVIQGVDEGQALIGGRDFAVEVRGGDIQVSGRGVPRFPRGRRRAGGVRPTCHAPGPEVASPQTWMKRGGWSKLKA